jgi:anaerobic ribonucleoside-triphosphate reductase activating protein
MQREIRWGGEGDMLLNLHAFVPLSVANGPGKRAVIWTQFCSLGCLGCFNPETHSAIGGEWIDVAELFQRIVALKDQIEGITISGGEPLQQRVAITELLRRVKTETSLSVILFSGFTWEEIKKMKDRTPEKVGSGEQKRMGEGPEVLSYIDVLVAGRYEASKRLARDLRGSANKTIHFLTNRYTMADIQSVPHAEVIITPEGNVVMSGIDPLF